MEVKEVLVLAAANLGRDDLVAAIEQTTGDPTAEVQSLLHCYNLVENELALDYLPLNYEEEVNLTEGEVPFSALSFAPIMIQEVLARNEPVVFVVRPDGLVPQVKNVNEPVRVKYAYSPKEKKLDEQGAYSGRVSARLISYGVAREFCLIHMLYEEAKMWEGRFYEAIRAAHIIRRRLKMRARRWI